MKKQSSQKEVTVQWWFDGSESCVFCHMQYVYETECRCCGCDVAVCPDCIVIVAHGEHLCPVCHSEEER